MKTRIVVLMCALLMPSASFGDDLVRFALSMDAHRCCASTGGNCAQLSTPDDCCQTQQQAATPPLNTVSPEAAPRIAAAPLTIIGTVSPIALLSAPAVTHRPASNAFKRLHDPSHLHSFPLLI
jgi:hypothetical protein